ncbi:MAG: nitroreductase family deazaflavin-dependent oxidoreductase, partial [Polyangiales bacterium]
VAMARPGHRPVELRALGLGHRALHRLSGGRFGQLEPGAQAPRGRFLQIITAVHRNLYIWTDGRVGASTGIGGMPTLLLTTIGRKSGLPRTVPLPYFPHPEGYVVVASYAGGPRNPAWYDNLVAQPEVELQIGARRVPATALPASPSERPEIWSRVLSIAPMYADYERIAPREIPLVVLREADE